MKIEKQGGRFAAAQVWSNPDVGASFSTPVLKDGLLFGLSDKGNFFCLRADDGKTAWIDTTRRDRFGAILDAGPVVLALPASTAELTLFSPTDRQYEELARIKVSPTPTYAHPVLAGDRLFVKDRSSVTMYTLR